MSGSAAFRVLSAQIKYDVDEENDPPCDFLPSGDLTHTMADNPCVKIQAVLVNPIDIGYRNRVLTTAYSNNDGSTCASLFNVFEQKYEWHIRNHSNKPGLAISSPGRGNGIELYTLKMYEEPLQYATFHKKLQWVFINGSIAVDVSYPDEPKVLFGDIPWHTHHSFIKNYKANREGLTLPFVVSEKDPSKLLFIAQNDYLVFDLNNLPAQPTDFPPLVKQAPHGANLSPNSYSSDILSPMLTTADGYAYGLDVAVTDDLDDHLSTCYINAFDIRDPMNVSGNQNAFPVKMMKNSPPAVLVQNKDLIIVPTEGDMHKHLVVNVWDISNRMFPVHVNEMSRNVRFDGFNGRVDAWGVSDDGNFVWIMTTDWELGIYDISSGNLVLNSSYNFDILNYGTFTGLRHRIVYCNQSLCVGVNGYRFSSSGCGVLTVGVTICS